MLLGILVSIAVLAQAQRPANTSICDYYTETLLANNTASNQLTVMTLIVNTALIGNYTKPNIAGITFPDVSVPGIFAPATINGTSVNLLPYFNGELVSSNDGGSAASINWLDGGGAAPLAENEPATSSATLQYNLLVHLYQFFGTALGCSQIGQDAFPQYQGHVASMYEVHKYMALDYAEVTYFIQQVGLSAESFGMAAADIEALATVLADVFGSRCGAPTTVIPADGPVLQSICITEDCPEAADASCSAYSAVVQPLSANTASSASTASPAQSSSTSATNSGSSSGTTGSATNSGSSTSNTDSSASSSPNNAGNSGSARPNVGAIAGGVVAGVAVIVALILAYLLYQRKQSDADWTNVVEKQQTGFDALQDRTGAPPAYSLPQDHSTPQSSPPPRPELDGINLQELASATNWRPSELAGDPAHRRHELGIEPA